MVAAGSVMDGRWLRFGRSTRVKAVHQAGLFFSCYAISAAFAACGAVCATVGALSFFVIFPEPKDKIALTDGENAQQDEKGCELDYVKEGKKANG